MKRLVYSFERIPSAEGPQGIEPIVGDVIVGIAMAAVGITGLQRHVDGPSDAPHAVISFPTDKSLLRFNLRIERALAVRGVKITKIRIAEEIAHRDQRAVA